jgi:light-regulated signal transduction histidine kinase (bacteriophytochrome)
MNRELETRVAERTDALQQQNEELQRLNSELTRSNRELDSFTYVASHDLKEPLRGIHNYAHFLYEDYADLLDEAGREQLLTLQRLTRRMEDLIESLLRYSVSEDSRLSDATSQLQSVLDEVCELLKPRMRETGVELRVPRPLPTVAADPTLVGELLTNLIANAMKYNNKMEKWVEVGYEHVEPSDGVPSDENGNSGESTEKFVVFHVRDNGIGILPKHHDAVFRIFKRLHGRDEFGGGTGAGPDDRTQDRRTPRRSDLAGLAAC